MDRSAFSNLTNFGHSLLPLKVETSRISERIHSKASLLHKFPSRPKMHPETATANDVLTTNEISFQGFIAHESLGRFLFLASKVKSLRLSFISKTVPNPSEVLILLDPEHKQKQEDEQNELASFVRIKLLGGSFEKLSLDNVKNSGGSVMNESQRFLDSLMYDSIQELTKDLDKCLKWYTEAASSQSLVKSSARVTRIPVKGKNSKKGTSDAIAIKYSKEQTDILTNWMIEHKSHPFPKADEINYLAKATNLTYSQVVNWTTNVRKRNLKATVEKGKKPHHFLDFLFLADYRDKQEVANGNVRIVHGGNRRKSALAKTRVKGKDLGTLKASKNRNANTKAKERVKRTRIEDESESKELPSISTSINPPLLVMSSKFEGANVNFITEGIESSFTTPMREQSKPGDHCVFGSYPNLNSVLSFVPLPRQVTPPRSSSIGSNHAAENDYFDDELNNLPPVDEMLNWPEHHGSFGTMSNLIKIEEGTPMNEGAMVKLITQNGLVSTPKRRPPVDEMLNWPEHHGSFGTMSNSIKIEEGTSMSEDAMVKLFTQNGLVSTPKRRDSFEMLMDLDDDKLAAQLENVFQDKEEIMSLSEDDLDVMMENDVPLDDSFICLAGLDDLEF